MDLDSAVELVREATQLALVVAAPVLVVSLVVGLVISLIQAVTQIQEQSLNFVPKILLMTVTLLILLPWVMQQIVDYTTSLFHGIPSNL
ncbi:MAG: flagellar biosynthesis protein FliQ [Planctomycetes bacterium]|nr:flagellar biosynthesis protein FliQ [Planctomycetota bacterium]